MPLSAGDVAMSLAKDVGKRTPWGCLERRDGTEGRVVELAKSCVADLCLTRSFFVSPLALGEADLPLDDFLPFSSFFTFSMC